MLEDEYVVVYEVTTNIEDCTVSLTVYFENTKETLIENFVGVPMTNYNDEKDILFTIDDMHIFLSELNRLFEEEQCSHFGNLFHKAANKLFIATTYLEPAVKLLNYVGSNAIALINYSIDNSKYLYNYDINSKLKQPEGYVYGQHHYEDWKFGFSNMSFSGCEVIAGYNLCYALGKDISLAKTIAVYEALGIEISIAKGFLGSNPYQISYFLTAMNIAYNKVLKQFLIVKHSEN